MWPTPSYVPVAAPKFWKAAIVSGWIGAQLLPERKEVGSDLIQLWRDRRRGIDDRREIAEIFRTLRNELPCLLEEWAGRVGGLGEEANQGASSS